MSRYAHIIYHSQMLTVCSVLGCTHHIPSSSVHIPSSGVHTIFCPVVPTSYTSSAHKKYTVHIIYRSSVSTLYTIVGRPYYISNSCAPFIYCPGLSTSYTVLGRAYQYVRCIQSSGVHTTFSPRACTSCTVLGRALHVIIVALYTILR